MEILYKNKTHTPNTQRYPSPLFYQHLPFYGKTLTPFFYENFEDLNPPPFKFDWALDKIRIEKIILATIWATQLFLEVSALLEVRHCSKLQSCAISWKTNDAT